MIEKSSGPAAKRELVDYATSATGFPSGGPASCSISMNRSIITRPDSNNDGRGQGGLGRAEVGQHEMGLLDDALPPEGAGTYVEP